MKLPFVLLLVAMALMPFSGQAQAAKSRSIDPQTKEILLKVDGLDRKFIVHVPPAYNPQGGNLYPVVFMFHGGGGKGSQFFDTSGWKEVGDREGFITVFPTALMTCVDKNGSQETKRFWMTSGKLAKLCPGQTAHDDVKFVKAMLAYINKKYTINQKRVYASGFSNGMGLILSKLLPELSDRFAAFAGVGSLLEQSHGTGPIQGARPLFVMIGENDDHFSVPAGTSGVPITESDFEANVFMKETQETLLDMLQLDASYQFRDKPKYIAYRFTSPTGKGAAEMRYAVLKGLKHVFPKGRPQQDNGIVAAEVFWDFFKLYKR